MRREFSNSTRAKAVIMVLLVFSLFLFSSFGTATKYDQPSDKINEFKDCLSEQSGFENKLNCFFTATFITYFLIPSLIVFVLVYGLMSKIGFFEKEEINVVLGLGVALLVMFNAGQLKFLGNTIANLGPGPIIFLLFILALIALAVREMSS